MLVFDLEKFENTEYKLGGHCQKDVISQIWCINRFPKLPAGDFSPDILPPRIQHRIAMDNLDFPHLFLNVLEIRPRGGCNWKLLLVISPFSLLFIPGRTHCPGKLDQLLVLRTKSYIACGHALVHCPIIQRTVWASHRVRPYCPKRHSSFLL